MSVIESIMETIAKALPDKKVDPLIRHQDYVGQPLDRVDGQAKVQGEARFTRRIQSREPGVCSAGLQYDRQRNNSQDRFRSSGTGAGRAGRHHAPKYTPDESASDRGLPQHRQGLCAERSSDHAECRRALGR